MFEKEAEEYREKGKREGYYLVSQEMEQEELDYIIDETFKDGAEFGYNKAKIEVEESYKESLCNSELNLAHVTEELEELEKENAELKEQCSILDKSLVTSTKNNIERQKIIDEIKKQLTKAKEIIEELYYIIPTSMFDYAKEPMEHARKFMTEE